MGNGVGDFWGGDWWERGSHTRLTKPAIKCLRTYMAHGLHARSSAFYRPACPPLLVKKPRHRKTKELVYTHSAHGGSQGSN